MQITANFATSAGLLVTLMQKISTRKYRLHRNVFERICEQIYPASKAPQVNANFIGLKPRFYRDLSQLGLKVAALNKLIFSAVKFRKLARILSAFAKAKPLNPRSSLD